MLFLFSISIIFGGLTRLYSIKTALNHCTFDVRVFYKQQNFVIF